MEYHIGELYKFPEGVDMILMIAMMFAIDTDNDAGNPGN